MSETNSDLTEQAIPPSDEISRDALIRKITENFGPECQQQMVIGKIQTGKTNLLTQFARQFRGQCVSYFISANPWTQQQHSFLYSICTQLSMILKTNHPPDLIKLEELKSLFSALCIRLADLSKSQRLHYYFVVDGIEWALNGTEGDRIIDLFPLPTSRRSPYLLFSCRSDKVSYLPELVKCKEIEPLSFNIHETQQYFQDLGLTLDEIDKIHDKYDGVPGYLKILKDTKLANPDFSLESAPIELDQLIGQQWELVIATSEPITKGALELISASPTTLPIKVLAELVETDEELLVNFLKQTDLIKYDPKSGRVGYINELIQEVSKRKLGNRIKDAVTRLIECIRAKYSNEEFLLTILLKEAQDYKGLQGLLTKEAILTTIKTSGDISNIVKRLQLGAEMARQNEDINGLVKWTLSIAAAKSFILHAIDQDEIEALLAIGESEKAVRKAYALPEITSKIRLLAKAYTSMKERGVRVPKSARDELETIVGSLNLDDLDKEIAKEVAIDLFPILPDTAVSLLEKIVGQRESQNVIELAIETVWKSLQDQSGDTSFMRGKSRVSSMGHMVRLISSWLTDIPITRLVEEIEAVESTKAKEYMIRQWCRQNKESVDITQAIDLWLDTVIGDKKFVIPLRSLRHISEVVIKVPLSERKLLIDRLRVPGLTAIDSPREEWVRFRLNLTDALFEIDPQRAQIDIEDIYRDIIDKVTELDVKTFCLARLKSTIFKVIPGKKRLIDEVEMQFQADFDSLLKDSADQFELTRSTMQTLVDVDPDQALLLALELNTQNRKFEAIKVILRTLLLRQGENDVSDLIKNALNILQGINPFKNDISLVEVTGELRARKRLLSQPNLNVILAYSKDIENPVSKSQALGNLAVLFKDISPDDATLIMEQAIDAWRKEDNLLARLSLGFELVESASKLDLDRAKRLYEEVQQLQLQPGSALATGSLAPLFQDVLELAIRAININYLNESNQVIQSLEKLIMRLPAHKARMGLYAKLAASAYRSGHKLYADQLVRTKIIPELEQGLPSFDSYIILEVSLPVIFEYDRSTAEKLAGKLPSFRKNNAWYSVILWSLTYSFLGDHYIDPEELRVANDHPRLQRAVEITKKIEYDLFLCWAIEAIAKSVEVSFVDSKIDLTQALGILQEMDNRAAYMLPDVNNIKHEGFRTLAESTIHGVRSAIHQRLTKRGSTRGLTKRDIGRRWREIELRAENIPNVADRVFVLALVAKERVQYDRNDRSLAKSLLQKAEKQAVDIPALVDRIDRLHTIADSWRLLREESKAKALLGFALDSAKHLMSMTADERLSAIAQTAYKVSSDFADELVSKLDSRLSEITVHPAGIALQIEKLKGNPAKLNTLHTFHHSKDSLLGQCAHKLLEDLASGRGNVVQTSVLEDWLVAGYLYQPEVSADITHWVTENLYRKQVWTPDKGGPEIFLDIAELIYRLAQLISPANREGIPLAVQDSFPGLDARVEVFQTGEVERARRRVQSWLTESVKNYLKICDPYFGLEELDYLRYVPEDCKILIITTDKYLDISTGTDSVKSELELHWDKITSQSFPRTQIIIVPKKHEDKFHDRAIISSNSGLDIGQSLNGLGKSRGKITILPEEDAKELESKYIDSMLDQATWFMNHDVSPVILRLGPKS